MADFPLAPPGGKPHPRIPQNLQWNYDTLSHTKPFCRTQVGDRGPDLIDKSIRSPLKTDDSGIPALWHTDCVSREV